MNIKIADFGIARRHNIGEDGGGMTSAGEKVAPHYHMSPEQYAWWKDEGASAPGPESDVYQFGLIMYQLVSGFNPNMVGRWIHPDSDKKDTASRVYYGGGSLVNGLSGRG